MSRNQQIIILLLAIVISVGLVVGAYMKKKQRSLPQDTPVEQAGGTTQQPVTRYPAPDRKRLAPVVLKKQRSVYRPDPVVVATGNVRTVLGQMRLLSVSITAAIMRNRMGYADLEKLDFTGGTDNPGDYAVFNPRGILMFRGMMNGWVTQDNLDEVTTDSGQSIWYSLRRSEEENTTIDVLYAVIPKPSAALCASTLNKFSLTDKLKFADDNGQVMTDREGFIPKDAYKYPSCLFTPDKDAYWFYPLRSRLLRKGSKTWQAVP